VPIVLPALGGALMLALGVRRALRARLAARSVSEELTNTARSTPLLGPDTTVATDARPLAFSLPRGNAGIVISDGLRHVLTHAAPPCRRGPRHARRAVARADVRGAHRCSPARPGSPPGTTPPDHVRAACGDGAVARGPAGRRGRRRRGGLPREGRRPVCTRRL